MGKVLAGDKLASAQRTAAPNDEIVRKAITDRLDAMRILVAVTEAGGFSAGARRLGVSASAATRAVASLEKAVGVQLFHRNTRSVRLTRAGEAYLPIAREAIERVTGAEDAARAEGAAPSRVLRLAMPLVFGRRFAAKIIPTFMSRHPEVPVEITLGNDRVRLIDEGVDLAIRIGHQPDSDLHLHGLGTTGVVVLASPTYLAREGSPTRPEDLGSHRLIGFDGVVPRRRWSFAAGGETVHIRVEPVLYSDDAEAVIAHAEAGLGLVSALRYQVADLLRSGDLVEVLAAFRPAPVPIQAVLPASRFVPPAIRELVEAFVEARTLWSD